MFGLDEWLTALGEGHALLLATIVAVLLGLRHATDPDHLAAVTTLVASGDGQDHRSATRLGAAWGAGHGLSLFIFGLPIVLASRFLPELAVTIAETVIGFVIIALAVRVIVRWRRGKFHAHAHQHDGSHHVHVHSHAEAPKHAHGHAPAPRSSRTSFGIGLIHGIGGSAGVGVLLLAAIANDGQAVLALAIFALGTAVSMAICSGLLGTVLARPRVERAFPRLAPAIGVFGVAFGAWYVAAALALVQYPF